MCFKKTKRESFSKTLENFFVKNPIIMQFEKIEIKVRFLIWAFRKKNLEPEISNFDYSAFSENLVVFINNEIFFK